MQTQVIGLRATFPQVRLSNSAAKMSIKNSPADMTIKSTPAKVGIKSSAGQLKIDSTQARQSMGYFTPTAFTEDLSAYSKRQYDRGVADIVSAGDQMADHRSNAIASLSFQRMFVDYNDRQFVLAFIPKVPPKITYTPGHSDRSFTQNRPEVQFRPNKPMINVEQGKVSIEVQPGSLRKFLREPKTLDLTV